MKPKDTQLSCFENLKISKTKQDSDRQNETPFSLMWTCENVCLLRLKLDRLFFVAVALQIVE